GAHPGVRQRRGLRRADRVLGREVLLLFHPTVAGGPGDHGSVRAHTAESSVLPFWSLVPHEWDNERPHRCVPERAGVSGRDRHGGWAGGGVPWKQHLVDHGGGPGEW